MSLNDLFTAVMMLAAGGNMVQWIYYGLKHDEAKAWRYQVLFLLWMLMAGVGIAAK